MNAKQKLIQYYSKNSKHSNYQVLPSRLQDILEEDKVSTRSRSEVERLRYMLDKIDVHDKTVLDIGGNTGYFTFELLEAGAKSVHYYEGNKEHADFVQLASEVVKVSDKLKVTNKYFTFDGEHQQQYDIVLLLNVLHHVGDDYGNKAISIQNAKQSILEQLNSLASITSTVIFQLGFNWQGDPQQCLFEQGTKKEMIEYITEGVQDTWTISNIGIAERKADQSVLYENMSDNNLPRVDELGEFLNRPLFILTAK